MLRHEERAGSVVMHEGGAGSFAVSSILQGERCALQGAQFSAACLAMRLAAVAPPQVTYNCFHQRLFQKCSETYM